MEDVTVPQPLLLGQVIKVSLKIAKMRQTLVKNESHAKSERYGYIFLQPSINEICMEKILSEI